jgi:hypothetical protein
VWRSRSRALRVLMAHTRGYSSGTRACGVRAAGLSGRGRSTCASDAGSKRCERWPHMFASNRMSSSDRLCMSAHALVWQIALKCAKALTHRSLCQAVRSWQEVLHIVQSVSAEPGEGTRWRLGFAGPASLTLSGFNDQMESSGEAANEFPSGHPLSRADSDPC